MSTPSISKSRHVSHKASLFTESVIREMTREALKYGAVNLSQGFPDFAAPADIKRRAMEAERDTIDRYVAAWLSGRVGETFRTRITGVQSFGFFATIVGLGGDDLDRADVDRVASYREHHDVHRWDVLGRRRP